MDLPRRRSLSSRHLVGTVTTWEETRYPLHTVTVNHGGAYTRFCSLPLVPLVGERIFVTVLSQHMRLHEEFCCVDDVTVTLWQTPIDETTWKRPELAVYKGLFLFSLLWQIYATVASSATWHCCPSSITFLCTLINKFHLNLLNLPAIAFTAKCWFMILITSVAENNINLNINDIKVW